jgi:hypothetical protein
MDRAAWFPPKWKWLRRFALAALVGVVALVVPAMNPGSTLSGFATFVGLAAIVPLMFWLCFVPIMHWRERYKGTRPWTWGAFLVFETSGWSKLFYWFMHVLPDANGTGLYRDEA